MNKKLWFRVTKVVVSNVGAHGAGIITAYAIGAVLPPLAAIPLPRKIAVYVGAFAVGMIVKEAAGAKIEGMFNQASDLYDKITGAQA